MASTRKVKSRYGEVTKTLIEVLSLKRSWLLDLREIKETLAFKGTSGFNVTKL